MGAPPSSGGGDKRAMGTRPRAAGSEGSIWGVSTMAWALLLISILTQGSGEASREGAPGTWLIPGVFVLRVTWAPAGN